MPDTPRVFLSAEQIQRRIQEIGAQIAADYPQGNIYLIGILKGACIFLSDLCRAIPLNTRIEFIGTSSYGRGKTSSGEVKLTKDLDVSIEGQDVILVEDIVDSGVTLTYLSNNTDGEVAWDPYKLGDKNGPKQQGCPNGGRPILPRGTLFRDPDTFGLPSSFTGSVRLETSKNGQNVPAEQQLLTATADTWNSIYNPFASYRAIDNIEMSTTVLLPLVDREVGPFNGFSTRFQIENRDPSKPAQVTIRFEGYDLDNNLAFVAKQNTLTVKGARLCFQDRDDFANCLAPGDALPHNFVGTARLTSTQPIGVITSRATRYADIFTNYRGLRPEDGSTKVLLPVLNKNFGPFAGHRGWNSWFRVLVADGGEANVRIRYVGLDLPGGEQSYTVHAVREFTVFQPDESILPDGFAGTAILESDRPIVALGNLSTDVFTGDTDLLYNGVPLP